MHTLSAVYGHFVPRIDRRAGQCLASLIMNSLGLGKSCRFRTISLKKRERHPSASYTSNILFHILQSLAFVEDDRPKSLATALPVRTSRNLKTHREVLK